MTNLATIGLARNERHQYFLDGAGPIPSVTTIVGAALAKPFLLGWARRETAKYAVRNLALLERMTRDFGPEAAADAVKNVTTKEAADKADLGTRVHGIAEQVLRGLPVSPNDEELPFVTNILRFLEDWHPEMKAAEEMICSLEHGYAGTLDFIAVIDGFTTLVDLKTGGEMDKSGVYEEFAMQLAAYGRADFFARAGDPKRYRIPTIERYAILHVRPEGYRLVPFDVTRADFDAFLAAKVIYDWTRERAPRVKGQPMQRQEAAA
jgi:hypothetical protein